MNICYNSYKNYKNLLSSQIPLNFYLDTFSKLNKIKDKPTEDRFLESLIESGDKPFIFYNNLKLSRQSIIETMLIQRQYEMNSKLELEKTILDSKIFDSIREHGSLYYNVSSNKDLKDLKKEEQTLLKKGINPSDNINERELH